LGESDSIKVFWFPASVGFFACAATLPFVLLVARRWQLIRAAGSLDIHSRPVPRLGGVGILAGLLAVFVSHPSFQFEAHLALLGATLTIWLTGLTDDLWRLHPGLRLILQTASSATLWFAGWQLPVPGPFFLNLFFTALFIVLLINAFNMLDGSDGLAAGVSTIIALGFLVWFAATSNSFGAAIAASLFGSCLGFLLFNFPPARIFMGDSGSYTLGFVFALLSLEFLRLQPGLGFHWFLPFLFSAFPVLDLLYAVFRRLLARTSPLEGDRGHFYDLLLQRGWSPRRVFFVSSLGTAILVSLGWLLGRWEAATLMSQLGFKG